MKILHVVPSYLPAWRYGGPIRSVHGLCRALAELGHEVSVLTTDADGPGRLDVPLETPVDRDGVAVRYFPLALPARLYRSPRLLAWAREHVAEFEVVHLHSVFLWPTSTVARAASRRGVPYVLSPRGMLVPELLRARGRLRKRLWLELVERRTLERAAAVCFTTQVEADDAARAGFPTPRARIVANGFSPEPDIGADSPRFDPPALPYVLYLGRLDRKKGLERLIAAAERVAGLEVVLAGNDEGGYGERLRGIAARSAAAGRLHFTGEVRGAEKLRLLAGAHALVLASDSENFGNVVLEALAAGRPVVVTPRVGLAPAVAEARCGWVVEPTAGGIESALRSLLADPAAADAMGARGPALVARYAWPAVARQTVEMYEGIRARQGSAAA